MYSLHEFIRRKKVVEVHSSKPMGAYKYCLYQIVVTTFLGHQLTLLGPIFVFPIIGKCDRNPMKKGINYRSVSLRRLHQQSTRLSCRRCEPFFCFHYLHDILPHVSACGLSAPVWTFWPFWMASISECKCCSPSSIHSTRTSAHGYVKSLCVRNC